MVTLAKLLHIRRNTDPRDRESWQWVRDADLTYCAGRFLLLKEDVFFRGSAGYLLHLSVEKYLKAARRFLDPDVKSIKHRHKLLDIWSDIEPKAPDLNKKEVEDAINKL